MESVAPAIGAPLRSHWKLQVGLLLQLVGDVQVLTVVPVTVGRQLPELFGSIGAGGPSVEGPWKIGAVTCEEAPPALVPITLHCNELPTSAATGV